ncbi:MAG: glutathione S-transferase family protein [Marinifilaceae bacterium]
MIKIISFKICPCYQKISALLEAMNIPYKSEFLDLNNIPKWFTDISPEIEPAIQTETGEYISGLDSVIDYIEIYYYTLYQDFDSKQKDNDKEWNQLATQQYINQCNTQRSGDLKSMMEKGTLFFEGLESIEKQLGNTKFFNGETLSAVDIAWLPILHRAYLVKEKTGYDFFADFPKLKVWQKNIMKTGIPTKSVPVDFDQVFVEFYLNESTYLGKCLHLSKNTLITETNLNYACECS